MLHGLMLVCRKSVNKTYDKILHKTEAEYTKQSSSNPALLFSQCNQRSHSELNNSK